MAEQKWIKVARLLEDAKNNRTVFEIHDNAGNRHYVGDGWVPANMLARIGGYRYGARLYDAVENGVLRYEKKQWHDPLDGTATTLFLYRAVWTKIPETTNEPNPKRGARKVVEGAAREVQAGRVDPVASSIGRAYQTMVVDDGGGQVVAGRSVRGPRDAAGDGAGDSVSESVGGVARHRRPGRGVGDAGG